MCSRFGLSKILSMCSWYFYMVESPSAKYSQVQYSHSSPSMAKWRQICVPNPAPLHRSCVTLVTVLGLLQRLALIATCLTHRKRSIKDRPMQNDLKSPAKPAWSKDAMLLWWIIYNPVRVGKFIKSAQNLRVGGHQHHCDSSECVE